MQAVNCTLAHATQGPRAILLTCLPVCSLLVMISPLQVCALAAWPRSQMVWRMRICSMPETEGKAAAEQHLERGGPGKAAGAAHEAALAALLQLASQQQDEQQRQQLAHAVLQLLTEHAELAAQLDEASWDAVAAVVLAAGDAVLLNKLLTEHGSALTAISRGQQWAAVLQQAAAAISSSGPQAPGDAVAEWAQATAEVPPMPALSPAMQLVLMGAHHTPQEQVQESLSPVVQALSSAGRTAEVRA